MTCGVQWPGSYCFRKIANSHNNICFEHTALSVPGGEGTSDRLQTSATGRDGLHMLEFY